MRYKSITTHLIIDTRTPVGIWEWTILIWNWLVFSMSWKQRTRDGNMGGKILPRNYRQRGLGFTGTCAIQPCTVVPTGLSVSILTISLHLTQKNCSCCSNLEWVLVLFKAHSAQNRPNLLSNFVTIPSSQGS